MNFFVTICKIKKNKSLSKTQTLYLWLLVSDLNGRPIGYCTTLIFINIIIIIICSLDFLFTISFDLGRWCKVSTHSLRLARYCLQHYLLRVSPT